MTARSPDSTRSSPAEALSTEELRALRDQLQERRDELARLEALKRKTSDARRYRDDPGGFLRDCIAWPQGRQPTPYQVEIVERLPTERRVSVRGPHGLGKTALASWVVLWFATTRDGDDWKVVTTASAWRQLEVYLWPEIHKWARLLRWDVLGRPPFTDAELLTLNLKLSTGAASAVASNQPALIEGAHADHILYLFDESKAIVPETWDAAEGAFSGAGEDTALEAFALAVSTPGEPAGRFYEIQKRAAGYEDWWTRHVTVDEAIRAGRVSTEWVEQRARQWGRDSAVFQNRVLGEFASSDEDSVIPLAWVEAAVARWEANREEERGPFTCCGVDVARSGNDVTVIAPRYGRRIEELRRSHLEDTMATTGRVVGVLQAVGGYAVVDVIGIGAGVVDRLRELRLPVEAFNAGEGTPRTDLSGELGFVNKRSAAWWSMRELLDPANGFELELPPDDLLIGDLTAPHWRVTSAGRIQVESKDDLRKRIGRSTDSADAVIQAYWAPEPVSGPGFVVWEEDYSISPY